MAVFGVAAAIRNAKALPVHKRLIENTSSIALYYNIAQEGLDVARGFRYVAVACNA